MHASVFMRCWQHQRKLLSRLTRGSAIPKAEERKTLMVIEQNF